MKKISFVCLSLLVFTACKNESKKTVNETVTAKKDSTPVKKTAVENTPVTETKGILTLKECTEKQIEYETEQECIFKNASVDQVYRRTIKDKEIEKAEQLLANLPTENTTKEINNDGLVSITYTVTSKKTEIEFLFEGGVTTLSLEQQNKDVKRTIIHSAD
ncbi:hypothetical protein HHL23_15310 [Chryseobacterium sp. RP-3-3]|uniref:Uncharacterized protein n=1 Tax=Chryseobacterium antibioticum TaxID=2728847 RepID=A0A7Y0FSC1_9FLAO|nr:hypothetical protein [Chryseobacterium antibioticum]NML71157.1 hypothetical protein [Chryseobacterium antibioticum]